MALSKPFNENTRIWVINNRQGQWLDRKKSDISDKEILTFNFDGIDRPFGSTEKNNSLSIARRYPLLNNEEVNGLAASIKDAKKIKVRDCILEFENNNLLDIGYVTEKKLDRKSSQLQIGVHWVDEVMDVDLHLPTDPLRIVQSLDSYIFFGQRGGMIKLKKKLTDLGHSDSLRYLREDTIDYSNEFTDNLEEELELARPKEDKGGKIEVFFGTNRNRVPGKVVSNTFGNDLSDELTLGFCTVSIPKGHIQGEIERPYKFWRLEFPEWLTDHFVLTETTEETRDNFLNKLNSQIAVDQDKSILIFIHGFNTSFEEAAYRTAQIAWDIPFRGAAGFFSWPSSGKVLSYIADGDKAEASAPSFSTFLMNMLENTDVKKMHIIAHSMGSRVLTLSLKDLISDSAFEKKAAIIQQIVLGAPDIDQDTFKRTLLPAFKKVGKARTLYTSDKDKALGYSDSVRGGRPRLGQAGKSLFVSEGLDTIEASNIPASGDRHSYMFDTKDLLMDLFLLFSQGLNPEQRRLKAIPKDGLRYWLFPK